MQVKDKKTVKSAKRVLDLLEYMSVQRKPSSVMDVVRALSCPQSSTSELLHCLVSLGYLQYDGSNRTFRPTVRVPILGAWVEPRLFRHGHLLTMMDELSAKTGQLIALGAISDTVVRYIHTVEATREDRMPVSQGSTRPLLRSACGKILIARQDERKLRLLVHRINAEEPDVEKHTSFKDLVEQLKLVRRNGFAISLNKVNPGGGMIAIRVNGLEHAQPLALGIGGRSEVICDDAPFYLSCLQDAVRKYLTTAEPGAEIQPPMIAAARAGSDSQSLVAA